MSVENERVDLEAMTERRKSVEYLASIDGSPWGAVLRQVLVDHAALLREVARLQGIVAKLPQTADGVPITLAMNLWAINTEQEVVACGVLEIRYTEEGERERHLSVRTEDGYEFAPRPSSCYSTRESAVAALRAHPGAEGKGP